MSEETAANPGPTILGSVDLAAVRAEAEAHAESVAERFRAKAEAEVDLVALAREVLDHAEGRKQATEAEVMRARAALAAAQKAADERAAVDSAAIAEARQRKLDALILEGVERERKDAAERAAGRLANPYLDDDRPTLTREMLEAIPDPVKRAQAAMEARIIDTPEAPKLTRAEMRAAVGPGRKIITRPEFEAMSPADRMSAAKARVLVVDE
jgi:hypothetical protein